MQKDEIEPRRRITATFKVGAIALAFLIIGYEAALFVHRASVLRIQERRDHPDTVFVVGGEEMLKQVQHDGEERHDESEWHDGREQHGGEEARHPGLDPGSLPGGEADQGSSRGTPLVPPQGGRRGSDRGLRSGGATAGPGTTSIRGNAQPGAPTNLRRDNDRGAPTSLRRDNDRESATTLRRNNDRESPTTLRRDAVHPPAVEAVRRNTRQVESFRFDPNTVSIEDLQRLGFSPKQAASIDNYRAKGGRFRRPADFGRSFVVADSVFRRLRPFIDIPRVDINAADSAAFDALPGIGAWTAAEMVRYRAALGGYSCCEQLMDAYRFDRARYDAIADLICCGPGAVPFDLWGLPAEDLKRHPCIRTWSVARAIVLYRSNTPPSQWTVAALQGAGILDSLAAARLSRCLLVPPPAEN